MSMNPISVLFKYLYLPICRAYSRHVLGDKPADAFMHFLCSLYFFHLHAYWPNLKNPQSFSEKIFWRMLNDHKPEFTLVSDKYIVREYVAAKIGSEYLVPLLWQGNNPEDIPFNELPMKYVIKANHGCKYNIIVSDSTKIDQQQVQRTLKKWLSENFCDKSGLGTGWAYKNINPTIIIETLLDDNGKIPLDYKFFCFNGRAEFLLMTFERFGNTTEKHFTRDFTPLDLWNGAEQNSDIITMPSNYEDMLSVADNLSAGFDFVRVDLYSVSNQIYFGELTCYPAGGIAKFIPQKYDFIFGEKWKL